MQRQRVTTVEIDHEKSKLPVSIGGTGTVRNGKHGQCLLFWSGMREADTDVSPVIIKLHHHCIALGTSRSDTMK